MSSRSLVFKNYGGPALHITGSTGPVSLTDFGLDISSDFGDNFELSWRFTFVYTNSDATPKFFTTQPSVEPDPYENCYGVGGQMDISTDYGGSGGQFATGEDTWVGFAPLPNFPYPDDDHSSRLTITYFMNGISGSNTVYPTVANANDGDSTFILCGYGIARGF